MCDNIYIIACYANNIRKQCSAIHNTRVDMLVTFILHCIPELRKVRAQKYYDSVYKDGFKGISLV